MTSNPRTSPPAGTAPSILQKLLITGAGGAMAPLLRWSLPTHRRFAERHGYNVVVHRLQDDRDRTTAAVRRAKWAKVELLAAAVDEADLVLWLDADTMVVDDGEDPVTHLPAERFQAMAIETFDGRQNPNTGVWLLRSGQRARRFLQAVLDTGQLPHSWADQATVCHLLGWDLGDHHGLGARPVRRTAFLEGTAWLPAEWNVITGTAVAGSFYGPVRIRHFAGLPLAERAARMAQLYEQLNGGRHG